MAYIIGRPINGVYLNGFEYVLDNAGEVKEFVNQDTAVKFLADSGFSEREISEVEIIEKQ